MLPPIVASIEETRAAVRAAKAAGKRVGFVPTMGALHTGHASLIRAARTECEFVVVSIFVNPTQFGPNEDFARYPRTMDADQQLCGAVGTDLIFAPTPAIMYPPNSRTFVEVTGLQDVLCGPKRPGHFRGVATVVLKLFNIVGPDFAYFGQKDAQQARIIEQMTVDLNLPLTVRVMPTVREPDGLAMSSRNRYLDPVQRREAVALYHSLELAKTMVATGERSVNRVRQAVLDLLQRTPGATLDYVDLRDAETLQPTDTITGPTLLALAVFFGQTRLIDNTTLIP